MRKIFLDEEQRTIFFTALAGISLIISFFDMGHLPINAAWVAIVFCGLPIIKGAMIALIKEFDVKADLLVSLALIASIAIGELFAAGEIAFIMTIGALLEERTVAKARAGIEKLIHLTPQTARVIRNGTELSILAEQVQVGDLLRVLAGETIPVDGVITCGQTSINQSVMTGESLPVDKSIDDDVCSGTVNQFGTFEMKATKVGDDSSLQRMVRLVASADAGKAKIVGLADRWATWIVIIALLAAFITFLITGEAIRAVTILVVFCPCALVLATPTAIMAGIGNATKYGILIREGDALERLSKVSKLTFDKTGTLTYGTPTIQAIKSFYNDYSENELLYLTACAERRSEHPLGKAITAYYNKNNTVLLKEPSKFILIPGRGVQALVDGTNVLAGNIELLSENKITVIASHLAESKKYIDTGCTIIYISLNNTFAGFLALSDTLRLDTVDTVRNIKSIGIESILLTGDHPQAANSIAQQVGIETVHSNCLPEDKLKVISNYQDNKELVCMVGDGINDAPALKVAFVGIAMGGIGSDIAVDAADIALVGDDIKCIPHLLGLSKKTMQTIHINLILSLALNFIAIVFAITGILNPIMGALVHNVGSVVVIINSARLLNWKSNK